jgi:hypothetical protein
MCTGKSLAIPEVLPVVRSKQSATIESRYTLKNLERASMQNKIALENLSKENSMQNSVRDTARSTEKGTGTKSNLT